ncbi:MAG TPA: hypothetical protein VE075_06815 [Thermoanaerobaculia bacterium]|nr:hypothetical protein [Thermoanaerobaculia bacterium]
MLRLEVGAAALLSLLMVWVHGQRLAHAGGLWRDEAAAARLATLPSLRAVWRLFPHEAFPLAVPLAIRSFARLAGDGDAAWRVFGFLVGIAVAAALWVSARAAGDTLPLLSLALLAGNAPFVVFGDSLRGYGLGSLCIVLGFAALVRLVRRPGPGAATAGLLALVGAVQCLLGNLALVAALCAAAAAAALAAGRRGGRRLAWVVVNIGLAAALSLLPYAAAFGAARAWSEVVVYQPDLRQIVRVLAATLAPAGAAWTALAGLAVLGTAWTLADRRRPGGKQPGAAPDRAGSGAAAAAMGTPGLAGSGAAAPAVGAGVRLFAVLALVLGVAAQLLFQDVLGYTPRAWYDLPLLALIAAALEPLAAGLCRAPPARLARIVLAVALAAAMLPHELSFLRLRMTNADLIARRLASAAGADDLVLVTPWYFGVSFNRYYGGPASWMTLPDLPDHQVHRYDLLKARLASPHPIDDVLDAVRRTLSGGHRVWVVGQLRFPPPGEAAPVLPPAPTGAAGWHDVPYVESWSMQLGATLRAHAGALARVPVPSPDPVSPLESMTLAVAAGWRP